jgi:hypothetical protein
MVARAEAPQAFAEALVHVAAEADRQKDSTMTDHLTTTALLLVDPYNDFLSDGDGALRRSPRR